MEMTEAEEKALREQAYEDDFEPDPPEQPEPEKDPEPEPEPEPETDEWAGVPAALRDQITQISERLNTIDNIDYRLKQTERRVGSVQNEFYAAQKAAKETPKGPTPEQIEEASKSQKKWDEMKEDFPEIAEAIEGKLAESKPQIEQIRNEIKADLQGNATTNEDLERRLVGIAHRDWQSVVKSQDYQAWLKVQSQAVQDKALYGQTAEDAIDVLDRFKAAKQKKPPDNKKDRLAKAVDAPRGPARKPPKSEADLTEAELRAQLASEVWSD